MVLRSCNVEHSPSSNTTDKRKADYPKSKGSWYVEANAALDFFRWTVFALSTESEMSASLHFIQGKADISLELRNSQSLSENNLDG